MTTESADESESERESRELRDYVRRVKIAERRIETFVIIVCSLAVGFGLAYSLFR